MKVRLTVLVISYRALRLFCLVTYRNVCLQIPPSLPQRTSRLVQDDEPCYIVGFLLEGVG